MLIFFNLKNIFYGSIQPQHTMSRQQFYSFRLMEKQLNIIYIVGKVKIYQCFKYWCYLHIYMQITLALVINIQQICSDFDSLLQKSSVQHYIHVLWDVFIFSSVLIHIMEPSYMTSDFWVGRQVKVHLILLNKLMQ